MRRRTKIVLAVAAVLVTGGAVAAAVAATRDEAVAVRVETVQRRDLVATVTGNGWIRPNRAVDVQADIIGRIVELRVREGEPVQQGALLLRIDPTQYDAAVARSRAALSETQAAEAQARAQMLQAMRDLERFEALAQSDANLVSRQQLEDARSRAEVQTALHEASTHRVAQARAALREAENQLSKTIIRAPISGVVTRLNVEEGETAIMGTMNNAGSLLLTISDLGIIEAVVRVDETDLPDVAIGDSANVEIDAFPRRRFTGRVTEIAHSAIRPPESIALSGAQAQAVDYQVVIQLDEPPPMLRPDFSATAAVVTDVRPQALSIPIIALTVRDRPEPLPNEEEAARRAAEALADNDTDQEGVFVVRNGLAHFVPVEIGIAGREHFEVLMGLGEGDSVVAGPYQAIRGLEEDKRLRIMSDTTATRRARS
ncbi:MAG TPA: efflux RND transporter periplasmic adaptor subunit [Longimicrobiales bacterium]|nr:efflux RND transporter periplasmic adaptor subunit [Longimicrobiales bacterium]